MNKIKKTIFAGVLAMVLTMGVSVAQTVGQQTQEGHDGCGVMAGQEACHGGACQSVAPVEFRPCQMCFVPNYKAFVVIDSVDCAVDLLRRGPEGLSRIGRVTTDNSEGRHDLKKILRPKSVSVHDGKILVLASSFDSSYVAVFGMTPDSKGFLPIVSVLGMPHPSYAFQVSPCGGQLIVAGTTQQGYDIDMIPIKEGLDKMGKVDPMSYHYHKPKQAERIAESDPWGIGVACVAVAVVFLALLCVTLILKGYGKGIVGVQNRRAKKAGFSKSQNAAPGDVYAAIAAAIYMMNEEQHDDEGGVITIQKVERAWSPWNAKFYNMNQYFKTRR